MRSVLALITFTSSYLVHCLPPPHPAVIAVKHEEDLLPLHLRSPHIANPHLREILPLSSLLHHGENYVFDREADKVPRHEIYKLLVHAGFLPRGLHQSPHQPPVHQPLRHYPASIQHILEDQDFHDPPYYPNPDYLQHL